jgi:hypothetical protein
MLQQQQQHQGCIQEGVQEGKHVGMLLRTAGGNMLVCGLATHLEGSCASSVCCMTLV